MSRLNINSSNDNGSLLIDFENDKLYVEFICSGYKTELQSS